MPVPKHHFKSEKANLDPSLFAHNRKYGSFRQRGKITLEIAAQRAIEVVIMTTQGETIGATLKRGYELGAGYYAWQAMEIATQFYRLESEKSKDAEFVKSVKTLFDFAPHYFDTVVESAYASEYVRRYSPAFRYSDALRHGDKQKQRFATKDIAAVTERFCEIALELEPENKEIAWVLAVAGSLKESGGENYR